MQREESQEANWEFEEQHLEEEGGSKGATQEFEEQQEEPPKPRLQLQKAVPMQKQPKQR